MSRQSMYYFRHLSLLPVSLVLFLHLNQTNCSPLPGDNYISFSDTEYQRTCSGDRAYSNHTGKCYNIGSRGPCGDTSFEHISFDNDLGKCVCKRPGCLSRPTVPWQEENRCYFIFEQGPCPAGHWLVPNGDNEATCETIPCPDEYNSQPKPFSEKPVFVFSYEGKCYTSATPDKGPCSAGESAYFLGFQHLCYEGCPTKKVATITGSNDCEDGSQSDVFGGCEPTARFL